MKQKLLFYIFSLFISISMYAQSAYYDGINFTLTGTALENELATLVINTHTTQLAYSDRHDYLYNVDEDPNNVSNVILVYSGESRDEREYLSGSNPHPTQTFNTEHVYPQSDLDNNLTSTVYTIARADLHHLRSCDTSINSSRGNLDFASGSGAYGKVNSDTAWYPGDDWKGDVARMILYLNIRYDVPITDVSSLSLLLQWNVDDPVDAFEDQRNQVIFGVQGNRNPFIDNPFLATLIWGGPDAEDRWNTLSVEVPTIHSTLSIYPNPTSFNYIFIKNNKDVKIEVYNVLGKQLMQSTITQSNPKLDISSLYSGIYLLKISDDRNSISKKIIKK